MNKDFGSQWRKWDLHLHTHRSHDNCKYNCTPKEIAAKIISEGIEVVGITNYFLVEEEEIEELKAELNGKAYLLPNFEFRINDKNKEKEFINIHVIFNPDSTTIKKIHESLARVELENIAGPPKKYLTIENLKAFGQDKITVSLSNLCDQLNKDFKILDDYMIVGVNKGYGGFCPGTKPRDQELAKKIDQLSHFIFSKKEDADFFLNKISGREQHNLAPKAVAECSDAHTINDIGRKFTWIKAEPTYEGLKQILFEPEYRITISDTKPREPLRKIEGIAFKFPKNTSIQKIDSGKPQDLCIKHLKEIKFNPGFTCLIGGRGTGKSTIINILAEKAGIKTEFFNKEKNAIYLDSKRYIFDVDLNSIVTITGTTDVEFVSQGRVEALAEGDELTKLIFNERIQEIALGLTDLQSVFKDKALALDEIVKLLFKLRELGDEHKEKNKEKDNAQRIVDSELDPRYQIISNAIKDINLKIALIENSKKNNEDLLTNIKHVINTTILNDDLNEYENRTVEIINTLKSLSEFQTVDNEMVFAQQAFKNTDSILSNLKLDLEKEIASFKAFFTERGTSEDSIKDSQNANETVAKAEQQIKELEQKINNIKHLLKENQKKAEDIEDNFHDTERLVADNLLAINDKLKSTNPNVLPITFKHEFDFELYKKTLFEDFYQIFKAYHIANTQVDKICEVLYLITPDEDLLNLTYEDFKKTINILIDKSYNRNTNYVTIVTNILSVKENYVIYKALIKKHVYNLSRYIKIKGFYGPRELAACSFGQRCTAVIVTLLMTGVKPLIIDEPEAHLDNKLIADYLVDLIKTKRFDRQIIFATHNSNFVVNGDAELIQILEIPDSSNYTNLISTTIENKANRGKLLKLEGGQTAFLNRENKYGLQKHPGAN